MLLMQRKSSENLLGFIFSPCFVYSWSFFLSLSLSCALLLPHFYWCSAVFVVFFLSFASGFLEIYCFFLYRWNCSTFDVIPLRTHVHFKATWRRGRRIFRYLLRNRKRNSPKCMEINAVIIPKSCGIKEAYHRLAVKIIFSLFWFYFILFVCFSVCDMGFFLRLMNVIIITIVDSVRLFCWLNSFHTVGPRMTNGMKQLVGLPKTDN